MLIFVSHKIVYGEFLWKALWTAFLEAGEWQNGDRLARCKFFGIKKGSLTSMKSNELKRKRNNISNVTLDGDAKFTVHNSIQFIGRLIIIQLLLIWSQYGTSLCPCVCLVVCYQHRLTVRAVEPKYLKRSPSFCSGFTSEWGFV